MRPGAAATLQPSKKTNAAKPQPWPRRALWVLEDTLARLSVIEGYAKKMDKAAADIDDLAAQGAEAVRAGNWMLAAQLFHDIRRDTANQRHICASIRTKSGEGGQALAGARVGEYEE